MGRALIRALLANGLLTAEAITAADVQPAAREALLAACPGVTVTDRTEVVAAGCDVLLVAVKPQDFEAALQPAVPVRPLGQLVVSIMAGVPLSRLAALFGADAPLIRVMPNILCEVGEGAFGWAANARVSPEQKALVAGWLNGIGCAEELKEDLLDAVTGLSGSGPAFAAVFLEGLADGGVAAGLPRAVAQRLAAKTLQGVGRWVLAPDTGGPADLKDLVTSPGGTTVSGLRALEAGGARSAALEAVLAAAKRARELA